MMQGSALHIFKNGGDIAWLKFLGPKAIASTKYTRPVPHNRFNIHIKWFANRTGFLGPIKDRNLFYGLWQCRQKSIGRERPIKMNFNQSEARRQMRDCFFNRFARRPHRNDYIFGLFITDIFNQAIPAPRKICKFIHTIRNNFRRCSVKFICGFASLEINIGILCRSANCWVIRIHTHCMIFRNQIFGNHFAQNIVINATKARFFMTCAETIKEMQKRHACAQCCRMRNRRHIMRLLHIMR